MVKRVRVPSSGSFVAKRQKTTAVAASTALAAVRSLKRQLRRQAELKYHANTSSGMNLTNTATFLPMNQIAEGTTYTTRDGVKINMSKFEIRYELVTNDSGVARQGVRLLLVIDKHTTNGITLSENDLFGATSQPILSSISVINNAEKRFTILMDKTYALGKSTSYGAPSSVLGKFSVNLKDLPVNFSGSSSTSVNTNAMYLVIASNCSADYPQIKYHTMLRFVDK